MIEVLDRTDAAAVEWWVEGGWAVDALKRPTGELLQRDSRRTWRVPLRRAGRVVHW